MADITDEFKITIVQAVRTLAIKFPSKQAGMLGFLSGILREEGGYEFKKSVVGKFSHLHTITKVAISDPDTREDDGFD